jgi:hypothetical protein
MIAAATIETKTRPRMPPTLTAAAWTMAAAGEKIAWVSPPVVMTNGGRMGKNDRSASRNDPG